MIVCVLLVNQDFIHPNALSLIPWNLSMPHPRDLQGGQIPYSRPGGWGAGSAQLELTDP